VSQLNDSPQPPSRLAKLAARKAGHAALAIVVCIVIWAFSSDASGYFWPGWVILIATLDCVVSVGKAALGDVKERAKLEKRYGNAY
jgi:hypothetical protein